MTHPNPKRTIALAVIAATLTITSIVILVPIFSTGCPETTSYGLPIMANLTGIVIGYYFKSNGLPK